MISEVLDPSVAAKIRIHTSVPNRMFQFIFSEDVVPIEYSGKNPVTSLPLYRL